MDCYCRAQGICDDCHGHICTGGCTCDIDGAPESQESVTTGWTPKENR